MENPAQDTELRRSPSPVSRATLNTDDYPEPQPEPGSHRGTPEPTRPPRLECIKFRIQQLHNRRFVLLRMQDIKRKAATCDDGDEPSELESVENELEELQAEKKALEEQGQSSALTEDGGQLGKCPPSYKMETPAGGMYLLPPLPAMLEEVAVVETVKQTPTGPITPADSLGKMSAFVQCPSCLEMVVTVTRTTVGHTVWLLCCMCSMMGCVAGCCFVPFCLQHLRNVNHHCPKCQAHIHTYQPL